MKTISNALFFRSITGAWLVIAGLAVIDGVVREEALLPALGYFWAHILSGTFMMAVVMGAAFLALQRGRPARERMLWLGGAYWVFMIFLLEWLVVTLEGDDLGDLFATYHPAQILEGQLISLGLLLTLCAPWLAAKIMSRR